MLEVATDYFVHKLLIRDRHHDAFVVVVIEGDGRPWREQSRLALDPSPSDPLLLDWFRQWDGNAVYLGRPCYYGARGVAPPEPAVQLQVRWKREGCDPYWFSFGRYSEAVVVSMMAALPADLRGQPLVLLGHSGGGTLAMLMASRLPNVLGVVTLAGNLDVAQWSGFHGYTPLIGSLDPARQPILSEGIQQLHLAREGDPVILPDWVRHEARRQNAEFELWPGGGHEEWRESWDEINERIRAMGRR